MSEFAYNIALNPEPTEREMEQLEDAIAGLHAAGGIYGESTIASEVKPQSSISNELTFSDDYDLVGQTAAGVLVEGATILGVGIAHLGRAAIKESIKESIGLLQRVTPGVNYYG